MESALWFVLLHHRGRLVRVIASICGAYDCSVCYVRVTARVWCRGGIDRKKEFNNQSDFS